MQYFTYILAKKQRQIEDTYIIKLRPKDKTAFPFEPGQYCFIKDPLFPDPDEAHPFSIASSPLLASELEFCVKTYGDWTTSFVQKTEGDEIIISEPQGTFIWKETLSDAVFLLGGIGISPIMSMLRTIKLTKQQVKITIIYGNRMLETIAYEQALKKLQKDIPHLKIIHIFSHLDEHSSWSGYKGFITKELVEKEINLTANPDFYFIGPAIFIKKMRAILKELHVNLQKVHTESLQEHM